MLKICVVCQLAAADRPHFDADCGGDVEVLQAKLLFLDHHLPILVDE